MTILKLEDVSYSYGTGLAFETQAVQNVSLSIEEGAVTGIVGHTGSGKSTMLQLLNGLLKPSAGRILYRGEDISSRKFNSRSLCAKVGIVFQYPEYQLFGADVITDVMFGPQNLGMSKDEARSHAEEALRMMGISQEDYEKSPFDLSGGQKRRVAIAGVAAMNPEVLVLDEPMAGLDSSGQRELVGTIMRMRRERGLTVVWSSHSMEDMARYADTLAVMNHGVLVRSGPAREILSDIEFMEENGLSAPEATYIARKLRARGVDVPADVITNEETAEAVLKLWKGERE